MLIPVLAGLLLVPSLLGAANGAVAVTVNRDSVSIQMNISLFDNLTTSLPALDTVLDQSSPILQPVQAGLQSMVPEAKIQQLNLHARTAEVNNRTGLWVFQENYTILLSGVTRNTGGRIIANLAFLSSKNNQSIPDPVSGVELNKVGLTYLVQGLQRFPPDSKTRYFAQTSQYTLPLIPEQFTADFNLLDLSWTTRPADRTGGYQPFQTSTVWNWQPRTPPYNVSVAVGIAPEGTFLKVYTAFINSSVTITAPAFAGASGTTVIFDIPTIAEVIMPVIVVVTLLIAVSAFLLERRVSKSIRPYRGKKR